MDIFIGGGGDDLTWLGLGVVRQYAADYAAATGRPVLYVPNARAGRVRRAIDAAARGGQIVNLIGHSWGAVDAYTATAAAVRRGIVVANLVTLDPVSGPCRRPAVWPGGPFWLNVTVAPSRPDRSDRLTRRGPFALKPSRLPLTSVDKHVLIDLNHRDVASMMDQSGARTRLDQSRPSS